MSEASNSIVLQDSSGLDEMENPENDVLNIICSNSVPESWVGNSDVYSYLSELGSCGIDRLAQEPERLTEEKSYILEQTQELAYHNYKTFIQAADCSREIYDDFNLVEKRLENLIERIPQLTDQCQTFTEEAKKINTRWRQSSLMLSKHHLLLEILEIPQLMDTCVRNGHYEEALELASYVKRLEKKHRNIPLIASIVSQVQESQQLMLTLLLQLLRTNIKLPECLKVIAHLRSMNIFTEARLRIKFLQARDAWFQGLIQNIPRNDSHHHITKVIELSRVHLFDIITQYRAVFGDDDPLASLNKDNKSCSDANIFHSWLNLKVLKFLNALEADLCGDLSGRIDSVLAQSMYFGLSFSRVGADFRSLLVPIFQRALSEGFKRDIIQATNRFEEAMGTYTLTSSLPALSSAAMLTSSMQTEDSIQPPLGLVEFPPVAQYCNQVLNSFNSLRLCPALPLAPSVTKTLEESLRKLVTAIIDFHVAEEKSLTKAEETAFQRLCYLFAKEMIPYLNKCLALLFPQQELAKILGVTLLELNKMENLGQMNLDAILFPMNHLLPVAESESDDDEQGLTMIAPVADAVTSVTEATATPAIISSEILERDNETSTQ